MFVLRSRQMGRVYPPKGACAGDIETYLPIEMGVPFTPEVLNARTIGDEDTDARLVLAELVVVG